MSGNKRKFTEADANASVAICKANYKSQMEWDNKDDQAYGMILLRVNPPVATVANSTATANAVWLALHAAFSQTGPLAIFTEFKGAIYQKISMASPTLDIMVVNKNSQHLTAAQVIIPEIMQAMILLNVMPKEMEQSKLTFNYIWDAILMEHSQLKVGQPVKQTVNKLFAVKWKDANPKWQPKQQQQLSDKKDNKEYEKKPCACGHCSGHEVKKCQAKQANDYEEDNTKASQLASSIFMATPPAFTTVKGHGTIIPPVQPKCLNQLLAKRLEQQPLVQHITMERATQDPRKHAAPQEFSGASIGGPSVYEEYQQAWDTLTNVNLPKSVHNLHPLEVAFTTHVEGKKRQKTVSWSDFTPSLPSTSTIEEVDNEDMISLGSNIRMMMEDIWDLVNKHLGPDMMDWISFGTFNEIRVKNRSVFAPQNCTHDAKVTLPVPSEKRQQEVVEILPNYEAYVHVMGDIMSQENKNPLCTSLNCGKCNSCLPGTPWLMDSDTSKHSPWIWMNFLIWVNPC